MKSTKAESGKQKAEIGGGRPDEKDVPVRFLTRFELAEVLKISVRTVDTMLAGDEIPYLRLHGKFIRFYLPDVVRHLTATALISKRGVSRETRSVETESQRSEVGGRSEERGAEEKAEILKG